MKLGIFGGGQLAWMLGRAAQKRGWDLRLIGVGTDEPAAILSADRENSLDGCDLLTFESEFLDFSRWQSTLAASNAKIFPAVAIMQKLSDKWEQKQLLIENGFEVCESQLWSDGEKIPQGKWVAKWSKHGYDGYGNFVVASPEASKTKAWNIFTSKANEQDAKIYLEKFCFFDFECALVAARDINKKIIFYPLMMTQQKGGVCEWVWGPATKFGVDVKLEKNLQEKVHTFLNKIDYVGIIAFEVFHSKDKLIVNEVAPRVHNSGHITLDAFDRSQFDLHLEAAVGFSSTELKQKSPFFMMYNMLGESQKASPRNAEVTDFEKMTVYWYGKKEIRPRRKLGHANLLFDNGGDLRDLQDKMKHVREIYV